MILDAVPAPLFRGGKAGGRVDDTSNTLLVRVRFWKMLIQRGELRTKCEAVRKTRGPMPPEGGAFGGLRQAPPFFYDFVYVCVEGLKSPEHRKILRTNVPILFI